MINLVNVSIELMVDKAETLNSITFNLDNNLVEGVEYCNNINMQINKIRAIKQKVTAHLSTISSKSTNLDITDSYEFIDKKEMFL